jgi:hypothetical protein
VHFGLSRINVLLLVCHQLIQFSFVGKHDTRWPFPKFHELSQCESIYVPFLGAKLLKCKFEQCIDEVHIKQITEKNTEVCDPNVWSHGTRDIMANHTSPFVQLASTKQGWASWDWSTSISEHAKVIVGLDIKKLETKHEYWVISFVVYILPLYIYDNTKWTCGIYIHTCMSSFRGTLHSFRHHMCVWVQVPLTSQKCVSIVLSTTRKQWQTFESHDWFFVVVIYRFISV